MQTSSLQRKPLAIAIALALAVFNLSAAAAPGEVVINAPQDGNVTIKDKTGVTTLMKIQGTGPVTIPAGTLGVGTSTSDASALVDLTSTTKGFLPPRMTQAQRNAIASAAEGLQIYQTDNTPGLYQFSSGAWVQVGGGSGGGVTSITATAPLTGGTITSTGSIGMPAAASGVAGYLSAADWAAFNAKGSGTVTSVSGSGPISVATGTTTPAITLGTVPVASGGTGQTTATAALNALLPTQTGNAGKVLSTDGSNTSWSAGSGGGSGTVTSVATGTGLSGGPITGSGTIALANTAVTPGSYTRSSITVDAQGRLTAASSGSALNLASDVTGTLPLANGGTGAITAPAALTSLGAAASGDNGDITSLTGLNKQAAVKVGPLRHCRRQHRRSAL